MTAPRSSTIVCDVSGLAPDGTAVDILARLQLLARRHGREITLRHASRELLSLLAFVGLGDVLRIETGGESEEREQRFRVQEERELGDPPA